MKGSSLASRPDWLVCPLCEASEFHPLERGSMRCRSCGGSLSEAMVETLRGISALPDAMGKHACECGHPEMRSLPDGTNHCPACGAEVLPIEASTSRSTHGEHRGAYLAGWMDGRFEEIGSFVDNQNLARWEDPSNRLDYYRGHRAGSKARPASYSRNPYADERLFG